MSQLNKPFQRVWALWLKLVEPPTILNDPDQRYRVRLVNSLVVVVSVSLFIVMLTRLVFADEEFSRRLTAIVFSFSALCLIMILYYIINRLQKYEYVVPLILVGGFGLIVANTLDSAPPHISILYLILLPLISTILLSPSGTLIVSSITLVVSFSLIIILERKVTDVTIDILTFMVFAQVFIVFSAYERNRLELERRELVVGQEKQRVIHDVIANLSHDLKTPLTIINTSLYLLQRTVDPGKQQEKIDQIQAQSQHLEKIVQDIIKISRFEHDREITLTPIQLYSLLDISVTRVLPAMQVKQLEFISHYAEDSFIIMANADELGSVFVNLLANAVTYTPEGGQIHLTCARDGKNVRISVRDTGIGIDAHDLPHIFDRFYRADKARSLETGGTGLGLAIAKHVMALHGGDISAESVLGEGTTFTVILPLIEKAN